MQVKIKALDTEKHFTRLSRRIPLKRSVCFWRKRELDQVLLQTFRGAVLIYAVCKYCYAFRWATCATQVLPRIMEIYPPSVFACFSTLTCQTYDPQRVRSEQELKSRYCPLHLNIPSSKTFSISSLRVVSEWSWGLYAPLVITLRSRATPPPDIFC